MFLTSKRFWKRVGYGFLILIALVMIVYGCVSMWANRRLAPKLATLRVAGMPTNIAELAPRTVPADEDGATYPAEVSSEIEAFTKDYNHFLDKTSLGREYEKRKEDEPPSPEQIAAIRTILEKHSTIEPTLRKVSESPAYVSRLDYTLDFNSFLEDMLDNALDLRQSARLLRWKSEVDLAEENVEGAVHSGLLAMQLSRLQEHEPGIMNGLVANAIRYNAIDIINRALRNGNLEPDLRKSLDDQLASFDDLDWLIQNLQTERAINLSGAEELFPHFPVTWQGTLFKADTIDFYEELLPIVEQPYYISKEKPNKLKEFPGSTPISGTLINLLYPAIESAVISANHSMALVRALRVLNALQSYEETHGIKPVSLADLDLPESAIIDPFDGKPLKFKWTDEGWIIYSAYKNGVDDGGTFLDQQDTGLGPTGLLP